LQYHVENLSQWAKKSTITLDSSGKISVKKTRNPCSYQRWGAQPEWSCYCNAETTLWNINQFIKNHQ